MLGGGTHGGTIGFRRAAGKWVKGERGKRGGERREGYPEVEAAGVGGLLGGELGSVLPSGTPFTGWTSGPEAQLQGALCASSKALYSLCNDFHSRKTLCSKPNVRALLYPKRFDVPTGSAP